MRANGCPPPCKRLKRWQRAFIMLYGLKINWGDSDNERIGVSNGKRQWYLYRQKELHNWLYSMRILGA